MKHRKKIVLFVICIALMAVGCANQTQLIDQPVVRFEQKPFQIPPGIDSTLAWKAKKKAERLFVSAEREQLADSLVTYASDFITITKDLYQVVTTKKEQLDTFRLSEKLLNLQPEELRSLSLEEHNKRKRVLEKVFDDSATVAIVFSLLDYFLNHCYQLTQYANEVNPFDLRTLQLLALTCSNRGVIFHDTLAYRRSIEFFNKFLSHDRGLPKIYFDMGQSYFELRDWPKAYEFYKKAKEIYVITSLFEEKKNTLDAKFLKMNLPSNVDPAIYYDYLFRKGVAEVKVHKADSALATLKQALLLAPSREEERAVSHWIDQFILWDGGNIYAAEQRDIINDSLRANNFIWSKNAYLQLLPQLKTKRAKDNITWRLAHIEYYNLDQVEEAGHRLYDLVLHADTSKIRSSIMRAPEDSMYKVYFKACGEVLFRLGSTFRDQGLQEKARFYFSRDTTFEWSGRGKAFAPLAWLVEVPENIDPSERLKTRNEKAIRILNRAKAFIDTFSEQEIDQLYRQLILIYQQMHDRSNAQRNYSEWNEIKEKLKRGS